jgi:hypothetical protein
MVSEESITASASSNVLKVKKKKATTLSQAQKFRKALDVARSMASLASEGGMPTFKARFAEMKQLVNSWQIQDNHGKDATELSCTENPPNNMFPGSDDDIPVVKKDHGPPMSRKLRKSKCPTTDKSSPSSPDTPVTNEAQNLIATSKKQELVCNSKTKGGDSEMKDIKMPPKMPKRGRPKGAELTVIGLPRVKRARKGMVPFSKLRPEEKNRILLECFVSPAVANKAILSGALISAEEVETNIHRISDMVRDKENVDPSRIEKFFTDDAWRIILETRERKNKSKWMCSTCSRSINGRTDSIACDRCLCWHHIKCASLKGPPKVRNWYCKSCKAKYIQ